MSALPPLTSELDRISHARLGALWFLPIAALVFVPIGTQEYGDTAWLGTLWLGAGTAAFLTFAWAWNERRRARVLLRWLFENEARLLSGELEYGGQRVHRSTELVQHEVCVSLLVLDAKFWTRPAFEASPVLPTFVTLLLGWWSVPWGPVHTVATTLVNLRGGHRRTVQALLAERAAKPAVPLRRGWWRAALALDSGNAAKIATNAAIALVLTVLLVLVLYAALHAALSQR